MAAVTPIQAFQLRKSDLEEDGLPALNQMFTQLTTQINTLTGAAGKTPLPAGVDVKGATISGVGEPASPTDAISKVHAETNYSAAAIAPKLEAGGGSTLKSFRILNSQQQQETYSTFLNQVGNTTPTTNTSVVTGGTPSGGAVSITVSAGYHKYMDGSIVSYGSFTDTVALPSSQAITSLSRTSGVVTASGTFTGLSAGQSVYIAGVSDTSFDGTFTLLTASGSTFTYAQPTQANGTAINGTVSTGGVYHYYLKNPSRQLAVAGPFAEDSQLNRLDSNTDQQVLIAVATVSSSGLVTTQSAGGATPPTATNGNRVLARL